MAETGHYSDEDEQLCSAWLNQENSEKAVQEPPNVPAPSKNIFQGPELSFRKAFGFLRDGISDQPDKDDEAQLPLMSTSNASSLGSGKAIIVNPCQRGNPVLELIQGVTWKYADTNVGLAVDYILGPSTGCLFLSLRYHSLKPDYIYERLKILRRGGLFALRILLCLVDIKDSTHAVRELTKVCLVSEVTLLLAFSNDEAATYLATFKAYQNKPADSLKSKPSTNHETRAMEVLSSIRSVNSTDAGTLLHNFGTIAEISKASEEDLGLCPGVGGKKAKSLHSVFREPFLKQNNKQ